jgi:hypothetical protein
MTSLYEEHELAFPAYSYFTFIQCTIFSELNKDEHIVHMKILQAFQNGEYSFHLMDTCF